MIRRGAKTSGQIMSQGEDNMPLDQQEMWQNGGGIFGAG